MKRIMQGLFCGYGGKVSSTKIFNSITITVMLGMFIYLGMHKEIPEWLGWMLAFMVSPSRLLNKLIDFRWGRQGNPPPDKE